MKKNGRKGVLTVEAAIIFPIFIMVMVFVLSVLKLFYFHLVMQQALQNVGRTLAQYGYVIDELIGLEHFALKEETKKTETELAENVQVVLSDGSALIQVLGSDFSLETIEEIINKGSTFKGSLDTLINQLKDLKNSKETKEKIINYLLVSAINEAGGKFVEWMIGDYLDEMQAKTGILDNLRYQLYIDAGTGENIKGSKDMILVVDYDYDLSFFFFNKLRIRQMVRVHPWVGGSTKGVWE